MTARASRIRVALASAALAAAAGCSTVLGFEEVELDSIGAPNSDGATGAGGGDGGGHAEGGRGAGGAGGAPVDWPSCEDYCSTVTTSCTDSHQVYATEEACLAVCALLPIGSMSDPTGNTVACRLINAEAARTTGEPELHCPIAGPGGQGTCGSSCEGFCTIMTGVCADVYATADECLADCETFEDPPGYSASKSQSGDTLDCRLYHATAAAIDADKHCPHAAGKSPCDDGGN